MSRLDRLCEWFLDRTETIGLATLITLVIVASAITAVAQIVQANQ
jgi:hypothetical protein